MNCIRFCFFKSKSDYTNAHRMTCGKIYEGSKSIWVNSILNGGLTPIIFNTGLININFLIFYINIFFIFAVNYKLICTVVASCNSNYVCIKINFLSVRIIEVIKKLENRIIIWFLAYIPNLFTNLINKVLILYYFMFNHII